MPYFIEVYHSQYTGNDIYSRPQELSKLERTLCQTKGSRYLKTIDVLKFQWRREKNGMYWMPGLRKLQPTPWTYVIPPIHFLNGTKAPKAVIRYETVKRKAVEVVKVKAVAGEFNFS